jgi:phosphoribosylamine--glycine ligase/phosphoribosylformylglycinamidine cyclo-ligase
LKLENAAAFVEGVAAGCIQSKCALVGGETAEMPGMYQRDDYDAAGAAIGAMSKDLRLPQKDQMEEGDILLGLASNGVHSNGFSLVRRILARENISYSDPAPWDTSISAGLSLLTPTKIYVCPLLSVINKRLIKGLSHITGGGLLENVPRMLPATLSAEIDVAKWELPAVFRWLKAAGGVKSEEMARTFNTGIGMVAVVSRGNAEQAVKDLEAAGETVYTVGKLVPRTSAHPGGCVLQNLSSWD